MKRYLIVLLILSVSLTIMARSPLTFDERVKAQEAIERVYYSHRIWPKENSQPKPSFEKMVTKEQIEAKVTDYLKKCAALDQFWQRPIIASQLQAEMERMAKGSKDPATLNELFAALNNDPYLIAECLARPILAERLLSNWYASDTRFHAEAREKAEEALKHLTPENFCGYSEGQYSKMKYRLEVEGRGEMEESNPQDNAVKLDEKEFAKMLEEIPEEGKISVVIEKNDCFVITHTIEKDEGEIEVESLSFRKTGVDEWLKNLDLQTELPQTKASTEGLYLPPMPEDTCFEGWDNGILDDVPDPRCEHTAVWTGVEMIVWGGTGDGLYYSTSYFLTGWRYNPSTDTWVAISTGSGCPSVRYSHTAVWTGSEMIIWGGYHYSYGGGEEYLNTGGRYNPSSDSWTATLTGTDCPSARGHHTAVWTGDYMIIWGGYDGKSGHYTNTGGIYDPLYEWWFATSIDVNCPSARGSHTAVWTGDYMIIWGGFSSGFINTGGKYDLWTDSWSTTSTGTNCPIGRENHSAVWTGNEMIIWGGNTFSSNQNTGGRYYPATDTWKETSTGSNCPSARTVHTAIWTGTEMIAWGGSGYEGSLNTGGKYYPATNSWTATSTVANCPVARLSHSAVWTGSEMIIWGGHEGSEVSRSLNSGARYKPSSDSWTVTPTGNGCPLARDNHSAVWTGTEMIIWGGYGNNSYQNTGSRYYSSTDSWSATSTGTNCPSPRCAPGIWTGTEMIIWGGISDEGVFNTGGKYNPLSDTWTATSTGTDCPSGHYSHTAVWTGTEMIIWGGSGEAGDLISGGKYYPSTDSWSATSTGENCPSKRYEHTAIWAGTEMIIWGGHYLAGGDHFYNNGGKYDPLADSWTSTSIETNCPSIRGNHSAIWTGKEMIIWGGENDSGYSLNNGGKYDPSTNSWTATSVDANCPAARNGHTAVWTGSEMIIWGGEGYGGYLNTGGKYYPMTDSWTAALSEINCPSGRTQHTAIWTGGGMIIWGGFSSGRLLSGGIYYIPYVPNGWPNNISSDHEGCASDSGVLVEWSTPSNWGDGSSGTRTFDVLRDSVPVASSLSESTLSYTDTTGDNGVTYLYQVRANNGCGLSTTTTGMSAADNVGTTPDEVSNFNDVYSWDGVPAADGYKLYRGTLADLPNLMTLTTDGCLRYEGTATSYDLSGDDPSSATGGLYWYLVTAYTGACEGSAGEGTGFTRVLSSSGVCP